MSALVPPEDIEAIVGVSRRKAEHVGRLVSAEQRLYILHSQNCVDSGVDLRDCMFSVALDRGVDVDRWVEFEDQPVKLWVSAETEKLVPERRIDEPGLPADLREAITAMTTADDVKMRTKAVIAEHLVDEFDIWPAIAMESASRLIDAMAAADLGTVIVPDFKAFVETVKADRPVPPAQFVVRFGHRSDSGPALVGPFPSRVAASDSVAALLRVGWEANYEIEPLTAAPEPCKHCSDLIQRSPKASGDYLHVTGDYAGKHNCATKRYGYHAEPVGTPCRADGPNPCLGARE